MSLPLLSTGTKLYGKICWLSTDGYNNRSLGWYDPSTGSYNVGGDDPVLDVWSYSILRATSSEFKLVTLADNWYAPYVSELVEANGVVSNGVPVITSFKIINLRALLYQLLGEPSFGGTNVMNSCYSERHKTLFVLAFYSDWVYDIYYSVVLQFADTQNGLTLVDYFVFNSVYTTMWYIESLDILYVKAEPYYYPAPHYIFGAMIEGSGLDCVVGFYLITSWEGDIYLEYYFPGYDPKTKRTVIVSVGSGTFSIRIMTIVINRWQVVSTKIFTFTLDTYLSGADTWAVFEKDYSTMTVAYVRVHAGEYVYGLLEFDVDKSSGDIIGTYNFVIDPPISMQGLHANNLAIDPYGRVYFIFEKRWSIYALYRITRTGSVDMVAEFTWYVYVMQYDISSGKMVFIGWESFPT